MTRYGFSALSLLLIGGCAATAEPKLAQEEQKICSREYRVGSTIPVVTCDAPRTEQDRQRTLDELREMTRPISGPRPAGSGG